MRWGQNGRYLRRLVEAAWVWTALYPVLVVGSVSTLVFLVMIGTVRGLGFLIVIPVLLVLTALAASTYVIPFVDSRCLRGHGGWVPGPWRYVVLGVVMPGPFVLVGFLPSSPTRDFAWPVATMTFVFITAAWNLWYSARRYHQTRTA